MANSPSLSLVRDQARPKKLGRYELEECLGADGSCETYRARVRGLAGFDRIFAVKCLRRSSGQAAGRTDPFVVAAKRLSAITDARVARVLDTDVVDGVAIAVSEFVHGLDLERFREWAQVSGALATGGEDAALHWQKIVAYIGTEIAGALAALHGLTPPLVHGGLSPRNVVATARGGIKLLDAGLAVAAQKSGEPMSPRTLAYASSSGAEPTVADDVRALGVMLFELATGELPPAGVTRASAKSMLEPLWPAMADPLANMLAGEAAARPRPGSVAVILGSQWADVTSATMATEMANLVRNFSSFVADGPPGGPPVAPTPEPVLTAKPPLAPALSSVAAPPARPTKPSGSFLSASDERTVVHPDERYATAMFQALAADPVAAPSPQAPAPAAVRAPADPKLGASGTAAPPGAALAKAPGTLPPLGEKRPGPAMRNAAPPVTARTLMMSPALAVPPAIGAPRPASVTATLHAARPPVEALPLPPPAEAPPLPAPPPRWAATPAPPPSLAPTLPAFASPPPPALVSPPPPAFVSNLAPLRAMGALPLPEPVPEAADWGAQALAALGTQAELPLALATVGPGTGAAPSPLPPPAPPEAPPLTVETFAYAAPDEPGEVPGPVPPVPPAADMPPGEELVAEATATAELLEDEQMENEQTPVFVPYESSGQSAARSHGQQGQQATPDAEGAAPTMQARRAHQAMAAPEEAMPRPARPRTASRSAIATASLDDESWQPPSRRKKLIILIAVAAGLGGSAAAVVVGLLGRKPAEPAPVLRKTVVKKVAAPVLPSKKTAPPVAAAGPSGTAALPARVAKPALAEKTMPAEKAVAEKAPQPDQPTRDKGVVAKNVPEQTKVTAAVAAPTKSAPPLLGGLVRVPIVSRPDGAMVWINGEERGKTPCRVDLKPGSAHVVLVRAGHLTSQSTVEVREGAKIDETLRPVDPPMTGDARFRAECKTQGKLPIVVDGKETGILCPFSKMRVAPGSHTIGLLVPATGKVHNKEIILFAGVRSVVFGD